MVWDFVYARRLLSNGTYRPIHDAVLGFERCMVAKARRILDAPPRHLAQVKTDCLLTQRLPKRFTERLRALEALRHPDGTPVYRVEETRPLLGSRAPRMEPERFKQRRWNGVDDPISHCLAGNSLLLTGLPGTEKTHLARTIVVRLREQGEAVHLVSKTHCSAQNLGLGAQRPTTGCAGTCAGAARKSWTVRGRLKGNKLRAAGGGLADRAARRLQGLQHEVAHPKEHAPLPAHQPHVPGLHKRAAPAARELRRARRAVAGRAQKRQRSKSILHFTCLPLALTLTARCSWLSSSVRAASGKGFWKMIMLSMTPCSTSSVHSSRLVLLAKHTPTLLAPSSWKLRAPTAPPRPPCTPARPDGSPLWT